MKQKKILDTMREWWALEESGSEPHCRLTDEELERLCRRTSIEVPLGREELYLPVDNVGRAMVWRYAATFLLVVSICSVVVATAPKPQIEAIDKASFSQRSEICSNFAQVFLD